jgi:DMSO/TMAO reductase YedYZ molybdopterin-dependent catalytic subunit
MATDTKLQGAEPPSPDDAPADAVVSPDTRRAHRIPPSQSRTRKWPVLDTGVHPHRQLIDAKDAWMLTIEGLVDEPVMLSWERFQNLPRAKVFADMHCVTRWSRLGNLWEGVRTRDVLNLVRVASTARFVQVHAYDVVEFFKGGSRAWSTNLPLADFLAEDCLFADTHDGEPLTLEHGGPLRLVVPRLYAWKSAKWVASIELRDTDTPGFWERGGYHMLGDPWKEQRYRFSDDESIAI